MKKLLVLALLGVAGASMGQTVYDSIAGPYSAFAASTGLLGYDDYTTNQGGTSFSMYQFKFVGGVTTVGGILTFQFYHASDTTLASPYTGFSVALPQAGNFIWTITMGTNLNIDNTGYVAGFADAATTGQWFLTGTAPAVGSNSTTFSDNTSNKYHAFAMAVPEPASMTAMGLGLVALISKRRKNRA